MGGKPIYAVTITDPDVSDVDKQHALIVGGQHGNEESGRMVALATIDWLVTKAAAATRRKQVIAIMPNVSPDSCDVDEHAPKDRERHIFLEARSFQKDRCAS